MEITPLIRPVVGFTVLLLSVSAVRGDDWPQWLGPKRDGVWRETGILTKFPPGGPKVLWKQEVGGGFSGPAIAEGRVFVMDRTGSALGKGKETAGKEGLASKERVLCFDAKGGTNIWIQE